MVRPPLRVSSVLVNTLSLSLCSVPPLLPEGSGVAAIHLLEIKFLLLLLRDLSSRVCRSAHSSAAELNWSHPLRPCTSNVTISTWTWEFTHSACLKEQLIYSGKRLRFSHVFKSQTQDILTKQAFNPQSGSESHRKYLVLCIFLYYFQWITALLATLARPSPLSIYCPLACVLLNILYLKMKTFVSQPSWLPPSYTFRWSTDTDRKSFSPVTETFWDSRLQNCNFFYLPVGQSQKSPTQKTPGPKDWASVPESSCCPGSVRVTSGHCCTALHPRHTNTHSGKNHCSASNSFLLVLYFVQCFHFINNNNNNNNSILHKKL